MKNLILFSSIAFASGLLFVNVYNSMVDAKSWGSNIPNSIAITREYFKNANPGDFFRKLSPVNQLLALVALIFFWKYSMSVRLCLGAALALYIICDVLTFSYFYPRNDIMFKTASLTDIELLKKTWSQWNNMNWIRSFILLVGLFFSILSLHNIYSRNNNNNTVFVNASHKADTLNV
jgi:hypothetical protein